MQIFFPYFEINFKNRCKYIPKKSGFANFLAKIFHFFAFCAFGECERTKKTAIRMDYRLGR